VTQKPRIRLVKKAEPPPGTLPAPAHLSATARDIWRDTVTTMEAQGAPAVPTDGILLETFAMAVARQRRIVMELEEGAVADEEGKVNQLLRAAESTAATVANVARALGLSPMARRRLPQAPERKVPSKWDDLR
jgi:P27 family predicted phage terminase small subunit